MTAHPVVVAIQQLHEALTARLADTAAVDMGPVPGATQSLDSVNVGLNTDDLTTAASGVLDYELGAVAWTFEVPCAAQSVSGDGDMLARLTRCYELVDDVAAVLRELRGEDGPVSWGRVVRQSASWRTGGQGGDGAQVAFAVEVSAFRDEE